MLQKKITFTLVFSLKSPVAPFINIPTLYKYRSGSITINKIKQNIKEHTFIRTYSKITVIISLFFLPFSYLEFHFIYDIPLIREDLLTLLKITGSTKKQK
jgi:hypothetical protein